MQFFDRIPKKYFSFLGLFIAVIGWGWAWVGIRAAVHYYEPTQLALGRYCIASLLLFSFWLKRGGKFPKRSDLLTIAIMGITGFTIYNIFIAIAEVNITAGTASLVGASLPILTTLGAAFFFGEKLSTIAWIGVVMAFTGVTITALGGRDGIQFSYDAFLVFLAMLSAAIYGLLTKRLVLRYSPLDLVTWSIWAGTLAMIPFSHGLLKAISLSPWIGTLNMILLGAFPGTISYLFYSLAISRLRMASVSSFVFLMPITAIILGWLFLGELPTHMAIIGGAITLFGAYLVNRRNYQRTAGSLKIEARS